MVIQQNVNSNGVDSVFQEKKLLVYAMIVKVMQGPIPLTISHCSSNVVGISHHAHANDNGMIASNFAYDTTAVLSVNMWKLQRYQK